MLILRHYFAKFAIFAKIATLRGTTFGIQFEYLPYSGFASLMLILRHYFAKFAIFAKIATLRGTTFGIQFEYLSHSGFAQPSGDFAPFLPFSPLHAFLEITVFCR